RTASGRWKWDATATWPSRASRALSLPKSSGSSDGAMVRPGDDAPAARILIVDDHEDNVELLRARLDAWGFETACARDGAEALREIEQNPPDLILLDVMMPKMDGIEVAKRVKGNPQLPFIPIIMQTALDATENKEE